MFLNHLPSGADITVQTCPYRLITSGAYDASRGRWKKRKSTSLIYILAIGPGGAGSNGVSSNGGGGGGSGGQTSCLLPASFVPEDLNFSLEAISATAIGSVYVQMTSFSPIAEFILAQANGAPDVVLSSAAGAAGTIASAPQFGLTGFTSVLAGQAGGLGGTSTGASIAYPTTGLLVTGGASGGGGSSAGGAITASAPRILIPAGPASGGKGSNGVNFFNGAFLPSGGSGGGGNGSLTAGAGGAGGIGCGGGGGGGSTVSQGLGGKGGPGLVIIAQW